LAKLRLVSEVDAELGKKNVTISAEITIINVTGDDVAQSRDMQVNYIPVKMTELRGMRLDLQQLNASGHNVVQRFNVEIGQLRGTAVSITADGRSQPIAATGKCLYPA
jgi:hypothetical protein